MSANDKVIEKQSALLLEVGVDPEIVKEAAQLSRADKNDKTLEHTFKLVFDAGYRERHQARVAQENSSESPVTFRLSLSEDRSPAARKRRLAQLNAISDANLLADAQTLGAIVPGKPR
jgi:hypothetical protein